MAQIHGQTSWIVLCSHVTDCFFEGHSGHALPSSSLFHEPASQTACVPLEGVA